jgi:glycosyltransferase involved in cell wall biosynthesis
MAETVTIILSNYNHGRYLPDSLKNICEQTRPADKILVIDDGSTDNSVQEISKFEAQYSNLRMIRNETNIGLQASIEKVMPLVITDCMVWSASDDLLLPNFLEKSMATLEKYPSAGMCFSELTVVKGDTGVIQRFATEPSVAHIYDLRDLPEFMDQAVVCARMHRTYFPPTSNSVVVRMWALKSVGYFRPELEWHSDWLAYNAVAVKHGSCVVAETLAYIREREDSYSAEGRRDPSQQRRVLNAMLDVIAEPGFADVKLALEKYPSYYSVWGAEILPIMRRRRAFWKTYLNFRVWLLREKNRASGLSWKRWLLSKIPLIRIGIFKRPVAPPQPVNLVNDLRAEIVEIRSQRESAKHIRDLLDKRLTVMSGEGLCDELKTAQAALNESLNARKSDKTLHKQELSEKAENVIILDRRIEAFEQEFTVLSADLQSAESSLEEFRCDPVWAQTTDALVAERDALQRALNKSRFDTGNAANQVAELKDTLSVQTNAMTQEEPAILQELRDELAATQTLCNSLKDQIKKIKNPSVLISTMPKSGTYYISEYLSKGLFLEKSIVSNQYFPQDVVYQKRMIEFAEGNYVSEDHFDGAEINLRHLEVVTDRIVVHVRDPRQATLSYIHYINSDYFTKNEEFTKKFIYPVLPNGFFKMSLEQRLDWGIENWLPLLVDWVESWVKAEEISTLNIKFTTFEFMVADENTFFDDIITFFSIPKGRFIRPKLLKDDAVHFRAGKTDEWQEVFTPDQIARANKLLPETLCHRFSWLYNAASVTTSERTAGAGKKGKGEQRRQDKRPKKT